MKKIVSFLLMMLIVMGCLPVSAASEDAEKMQEVLLIVKSKIEVPDELSEFSGNVSDFNGDKTYRFEWRTSDYKNFMYVSSDEYGRIINYNRNIFKTGEKKISKVSKKELIVFAESFLRTTIPEAFKSDSDYLVYNDEDYYAYGNLMYNLGFRREKNGIIVKDNYASVTAHIEDDKIFISNMNVNFAYDVKFDEEKNDIENYEAKYQELFPVEIIYRDEYKPLAKRVEMKSEPTLIYRIKNDDIGYIDSFTGEIIKEDISESTNRKESASEDAVVNMGAAGGGASLTPQEVTELKNIEGLLDVETIEKNIKKLPYLEFSDEYKLENSDLYKDDMGKYYYRTNYIYEKENIYKYFNMKVNAEDGEIISLSNSYAMYDGKITLTDVEKSIAEKKIEDFLNKVAKGKLSQTESKEQKNNGEIISKSFVRIVNGIKYINDGISINFDAKNSLVRNYNLDFIDADFADPKDVVPDDIAYEKILEYAPIIPIYIKSGGTYKKAFTLEQRNISVDAITGEVKNKITDKNYTYSDISGHWVEEAAIKLSEIQIGIDGGKLEPERKITQEDFFRVLSSSILGEYYSDYTSEELYDMLIRNKYITEEEKSPESKIKREDAFVYLIRMAGLEKVAKLSDIYKISYKDESALSDGKIGYAAILSGLGVICGDGGKLRPQDELTRAEAIMIAYKYLLTL